MTIFTKISLAYFVIYQSRTAGINKIARPVPARSTPGPGCGFVREAEMPPQRALMSHPNTAGPPDLPRIVCVYVPVQLESLGPSLRPSRTSRSSVSVAPRALAAALIVLFVSMRPCWLPPYPPSRGAIQEVHSFRAVLSLPPQIPAHLPLPRSLSLSLALTSEFVY